MATVQRILSVIPKARYMLAIETFSAIHPFTRSRSRLCRATFEYRASIITAISYHTKKFVSTFIYPNLQILSKIFMLLWFTNFLKRVKNADNRHIGGDLKKAICFCSRWDEKNIEKFFKKLLTNGRKCRNILNIEHSAKKERSAVLPKRKIKRGERYGGRKDKINWKLRRK